MESAKQSFSDLMRNHRILKAQRQPAKLLYFSNLLAPTILGEAEFLRNYLEQSRTVYIRRWFDVYRTIEVQYSKPRRDRTLRNSAALVRKLLHLSKYLSWRALDNFDAFLTPQAFFINKQEDCLPFMTEVIRAPGISGIPSELRLREYSLSGAGRMIHALDQALERAWGGMVLAEGLRALQLSYTINCLSKGFATSPAWISFAPNASGLRFALKRLPLACVVKRADQITVGRSADFRRACDRISVDFTPVKLRRLPKVSKPVTPARLCRQVGLAHAFGIAFCGINSSRLSTDGRVIDPELSCVQLSEPFWSDSAVIVLQDLKLARKFKTGKALRPSVCRHIQTKLETNGSALVSPLLDLEKFLRCYYWPERSVLSTQNLENYFSGFCQGILLRSGAVQLTDRSLEIADKILPHKSGLKRENGSKLLELATGGIVLQKTILNGKLIVEIVNRSTQSRNIFDKVMATLEEAGQDTSALLRQYNNRSTPSVAQLEGKLERSAEPLQNNYLVNDWLSSQGICMPANLAPILRVASGENQMTLRLSRKFLAHYSSADLKVKRIGLVLLNRGKTQKVWCALHGGKKSDVYKFKIGGKHESKEAIVESLELKLANLGSRLLEPITPIFIRC